MGCVASSLSSSLTSRSRRTASPPLNSSAMHQNTLPLAYWTLGAQFLRLAHESCIEIVNGGNKYLVTSDKPIAPSAYGQATRWSDHSVGTGVLFSFFHGVELTLKGFLVAGGSRPTHHRLTDLLRDFEAKFPGTDLGDAVRAALPSSGVDSPMGRFLSSNSIQIESWYEALKYPESTKGRPFDHFDLKFGGATALPFWQDLHASSAAIHSKAVALSRRHGYA